MDRVYRWQVEFPSDLTLKNVCTYIETTQVKRAQKVVANKRLLADNL